MSKAPSPSAAGSPPATVRRSSAPVRLTEWAPAWLAARLGLPEATETVDAAKRAIERRQPVETARLAGWVNHTDERVPVYLLRRWADALRGAPDLIAGLEDRAQRGAAIEGVVWTPLLDQLASHRGVLAGGGTETPCPPALRAWVAGADDPAAVRALFVFEYWTIRRAIAAELRVLDRELLALMLDPVRPLTLGDVLGANRPLHAQLLPLLVAEAERLAEPHDHPLMDRCPHCGLGGQAIAHLSAAADRGAALPPDLRARLLALHGRPLAGAARPGAHDRQLAEIALRDPTLPADEVERLRAAHDREPQVARLAILHPTMTPDRALALERTTWGASARLWMAASPTLRRDPAVRALLKGSRVVDVVAALAEDADLPDFARALTRLAKLAPARALDRLERLPATVPLPLRTADLLALLKNTSADLRRRVAALVHRATRVDPAAAAPAPSETRPGAGRARR